MEWLKTFNNDYANAVAALTPVVSAWFLGCITEFIKKAKQRTQAQSTLRQPFGVSDKNTE